MTASADAALEVPLQLVVPLRCPSIMTASADAARIERGLDSPVFVRVHRS